MEWEATLLVIVLKGYHRGLWNVQRLRLVISRSPDRLRHYSQLEVPRHVWVDLYLQSVWDYFPRPSNEGLRNKPRLVKLLGPLTGRYRCPICSFPTLLLGHRKRWILVLLRGEDFVLEIRG